MRLFASFIFAVAFSLRMIAGGCAPVVIQQPLNATICENADTSFMIVATGSSLIYQWQVNQGSGFVNLSNVPPYSGVNTAMLSISTASDSLDGFLYRCIVTNGCAPDDTSSFAELTVNSATTIISQPSFVEACEGENADIFFTAHGTGITFQWQVNTGSGYVSLTETSPYTGVNTNSLTILPVAAAMNGYLYQCIVTGACGSDTTYEIPLVVRPSYINNISATLCQGDTMMFGSSALTVAGSYSNLFSTIYSCDSLVNLSLNVLPNSFTTETSTICDGDSILIGGTYQSSAGTYTYVLGAFNGCDSIIENTLSVIPSYSFNQTTIICAGDSALIFGVYETVDSVYSQNWLTYLGCDSVYTHALIVKPDYDQSVEANICAGDSILIGATYETTAGTYINSYFSAFGCDSIVRTTLFVHPLYNDSLSLTICSNDSVFLAGAFQNTAGIYTDSLTSFYGCDSTVVTTLFVNAAPVVTLSFPLFLCHWEPPAALTYGSPPGGTYSGPGVTSGNIFSAGVVGEGIYGITYTYTDSLGCSVSVLDSLEVMICEGVNELSSPLFSVYPNPFNSSVMITTAEPSEMCVSDLLGQVLLEKSLPGGTTELPLEELSKGVYFIQVRSGERNSVLRLIKD